MTLGILLVDDNPIQAATRRIILEKAGFQVTVAGNGRTALELFASPACFAMVITDHLMPEMNGPELVKELRDQKFGLTNPVLPILVLSGLPDAEEAYAGMDVIFRLKPLPPEELISLVRDTICPPMSRTA
ncbi:MAG: response regulator [Acidobacteriaceae bacterium]